VARAGAYIALASHLFDQARAFDGVRKRDALVDAAVALKSAIKIDGEAADGWNLLAAVLLLQIPLSPTADRSVLLNQAQWAAEEAHGLIPDFGLYNLACVHALRGNERLCRERLTEATKFERTLPP
jgi:hypothetical protein